MPWTSPTIPYPVTPPGDAMIIRANPSWLSVLRYQRRAQQILQWFGPPSSLGTRSSPTLTARASLGTGSRGPVPSSPSALGRAKGPTRTQFHQHL
jgi:hypothetical protein